MSDRDGMHSPTGSTGGAGQAVDLVEGQAETAYSVDDLIAIMAALRHPDSGCPWDQKQTFASIVPYTIEEAYEVADAIERGDMADLAEELGDLLLQVVYHARMAEEAGDFSFGDVVSLICRKMVRRHPHVFGTPEERANGAPPGFWEAIKAEEKAEKAAARARHGYAGEARDGLLEGVPANLPALTQAVKLQGKAARVGFDWPSLGEVFDKMREELGELAEAQAKGDDAAIREEFGDVMFVMANVARHLKIDPEAALAQTNAKFRRRFARVEALLEERGKTPEQSDLEEMDALWNLARAEDKRKERK